jgi:RNA polymerase sigma-70 factor (ECF subfamily)
MTIKYEFCDGTINTVEVDAWLYDIHEELVKEEKRKYKRETRRHISLEYLNGYGIDFDACENDPLATLIKQEDEKKLHIAIELLPKNQRALVNKIFYEGRTLTEIAEAERVSQSAISQRLMTIFKKFKKLF